MNEIRIIRTEHEYDKAVELMESLWGAEQNTPDGDKLDLLLLVIKEYEDKNYPLPDPDPIEAILFRMEQENMNKSDLAKVIGYRSRVSEVLSRKRRLTLDMIRSISKELSIPTDILINDYPLNNQAL